MLWSTQYGYALHTKVTRNSWRICKRATAVRVLWPYCEEMWACSKS